MSKATKGRITKRRKLKKIEKGRKLQKAEKGGKIQYSKGKIRGKISPRRIKKVATNSPELFSSSKQCRKKTKCRKLQKVGEKHLKHKII